MKRQTLSVAKIAVTALLSFLVLANTASAEFTISPGQTNPTMRYQVSGGDSKTGSVVIRNTGEEEIQVKVTANDGTKTAEGSFAAKKSYEEQVALGLWTTFSQDVFTLKGKEEKTIQFDIAIPADIPPGVYAGGIAIERYAPAAAEGSNFGVTINTRVVIPFYVDVPGTKINKVTLSSLQYEAFRENDHFFVASLTNEGNTAVIVKPKITIDGFFGLYHQELTDDDIYLYRGDKTSFRINWDDVPLGGFFTARAAMEYYENDIVENTVDFVETLRADIPVTIIPWLPLIIILVLAAGIIGAVVYKKGRYKGFMRSAEKYAVQPGDTLTGLAKKYGVNWKLLAKLNKLEPPYSLEDKKEILIPRKKKE